MLKLKLKILSNMKFPINNEWYIRSLDRRNWIIARMVTPTHKRAPRVTQEQVGGSKRKDYESVHGYYPTLQRAKEGAVEFIAKEGDTMEELEKAVRLIKSIEI